MVLNYMSGMDDGRIIYATYLESIIQSLRGRYIKNGCNVSANASTLSVDIADGVVIYEGQEYIVAAENLALAPALIDKDRADVIVWDYAAGTPTLSVITGTRWLTLADGSVIPITDRITDSQIPLAIVIVRAGATSVTTTDVIDVRTGLDGINTINIIVSDNIEPSLNGVGDIGKVYRKYQNLYVVNAYVGDIILDNNYIISEYDDNKNLIDGFRILDDSGKELFKVVQDGVYFKGQKIV